MLADVPQTGPEWAARMGASAMDIALLDLWLAIVLSSVAVFFLSFVFWAATPWHNADIKPLPDQAGADAAIAPLNLKPGFYLGPCTHDPAEMKSDAFKERYARGPWYSINVFGARPSMGRSMALTFLSFVIVSVLVGYIASETVLAGADFWRVFQVTCTAALLGHTFGGLPNDIWFGKPKGWLVRDLIDSVVYAVVTGVMFGLFWPGAGVPTPA